MHDVIILGGGPAGVAAGIYAKRYNMNMVLITESIGGLINETHEIDNYPGFPMISGAELAMKFEEHLRKLEVPIEYSEVESVEKQGEKFIVKTANGKTFESISIIIALGSRKKRLGVEGEKKLKGRGVSYCATCDAAFFKDKVVGVVGGNDSAAEAAMLLSKHASKVYVIYRREKIRAKPSLTEQIYSNPKIEVIHNTNVARLIGESKLEKAVLNNGTELSLDGLFVEIGQEPSTQAVEKLGLELDPAGYIKTDERMRTNIEGAFAAGDIRTTPLRQVVTAAADGAIAATSAFIHVQVMKRKQQAKE